MWGQFSPRSPKLSHFENFKFIVKQMKYLKENLTERFKLIQGHSRSKIQKNVSKCEIKTKLSSHGPSASNI